jgi:hypothetical protein
MLNTQACALIRLQLCIVQGMVAERLDCTEYASLFAVNTLLSLAAHQSFRCAAHRVFQIP